MCKCHSYNGEYGTTPEVMVPAPEWALTCLGEPKETICLDACIAETIQELWRRGICTESSCCGHNRMRPSVVVSTDEDMAHVKKVLDEIDRRNWEISQWQRVVFQAFPWFDYEEDDAALIEIVANLEWTHFEKGGKDKHNNRLIFLKNNDKTALAIKSRSISAT